MSRQVGELLRARREKAVIEELRNTRISVSGTVSSPVGGASFSTAGGFDFRTKTFYSLRSFSLLVPGVVPNIAVFRNILVT